MISASENRRRRALLFSTLASVAIHAIVLGSLFYALIRAVVPRGAPETFSQITIASIAKRTAPPQRPPLRLVPRRIVAPPPSRHEVAREAASAPRLPQRPRSTVSTLARDEENFSREVAQLNKADDPHAIPTIDPASQPSTMKSYRFGIPASMQGDEHGNGTIFPTRNWTDRGLDCYYGRYEYTYPDGAQESGAIAWPFCYDPAADPFKEPPHPIAFPPPPTAFVLPPGTDLPPIEKEFYEHWIANQ